MNNNTPTNLTIIILTYNEEKNILDCLNACKGIHASIFVVDSFSTDRTIDILNKTNTHFQQHPFDNYAQQRNWAQFNNPFNTEWVLHLDAGERISENLKEWLNSHFDAQKDGYDGFMFSRQTFFLGRWMKHGGHYPNFHLRLYKYTKGHCENKAYDQHFVVDGKISKVKQGYDIIDIVANNAIDLVRNHLKWAVFEAVEIIEAKKTGEVNGHILGNPIEKKRWYKNNIFQKAPLFMRSFAYFFFRYFVKFGFLDGREGLIFHVLQGFWFRFTIDAVVFDLLKKGVNTKKMTDTVFDEYDIRIKTI